MNSNLLGLLLLGHILADYYFQNEELANKKRKKFLHLLMHCMIHLVVCFLLVLPCWNRGFYWVAVAAAGSHFVIDFIKYLISKVIDGNGRGATVRWLRRMEEQSWLYSLDQLAHLGALTVLGLAGSFYFGSAEQWGLPGLPAIALPVQVLKYAVAILVILKPANVTFRMLFKQNKPAEEEAILVKDMQAGQQIGNMERLLMFVLLSLGQYTAIALVFTAKSVTRYNRIAKEQAFAEYYLLGTLYSILVVLAAHIARTLL